MSRTATMQTAQTSQAARMTRVFMNGRSQAVRIPAEFRFEEEEVFVNRIGDTLMITPRSSLESTLRLGAELIPDDFMADGRPYEIPAVREIL